MALETILTIAIYAIIIYVIFKIVRKIAKAFFYAGLLTLLILLVSGFFIVKDIMSFKENFTEQGRSLVILEENGNILTGYSMKPSPKFLTAGQISEYSNYLENNEYDKILGDKYKLMIVKLDLVSDLEKEMINLGEVSLKKESMKNILRSNEPFDLLNNAIAEDNNVLPGAVFDARFKEDSLMLKAALLGTIVDEELLGAENAVNFFKQYKKGNIIIYPETALFKFVKLVPVDWIRSIVKNAFVKAKSGITGGISIKIEEAYSIIRDKV